MKNILLSHISLKIAAIVVICLGCSHAPIEQPNWSETEISTDLAKDLRLMWQTEPLKGNVEGAGPNPKASSEVAIRAASRVFNTVQLIGRTRSEILVQLGDSRCSNDSIYNFPFYRAELLDLVYRFDNGQCGWEFHIRFDGHERAQQVERHWIK